MNLEALSDKNLQELERLTLDLLVLLRKTKLTHEPVAEALRELEMEASKTRRERFDAVNPEFQGF